MFECAHLRGKWSVQTSKQANIHMHWCNAVMLYSLGLARAHPNHPNKYTDCLYPLEWLPFCPYPKEMSQFQDFPTVLPQLGGGATSGVALFKTSLRVAEGSFHQLLRYLTHTWKHGRSTTQQECHPLGYVMEFALHCWNRCTVLVGRMVNMITIPCID